MLLVSVFKDFGNTRDRVKDRTVAQNNLERLIKTWSTNLPQNSIIYNIGSSFRYQFHLPLQSFAYLRPIKGFIGADSSNQSPLQRQLITDLGLSDDFYASLAQKGHVYMVGRKGQSRKEIDRLRFAINALKNHYKDRYGLELSLVEEPNLPDLYRMVFNRQDGGN